MNKSLNQIKDVIMTSKKLSKQDREALEALLLKLQVELEKLGSEHKEQAKLLAQLTRDKVYNENDETFFQDTLIEFESSHLELVKTINLICHSLSNLGV